MGNFTGPSAGGMAGVGGAVGGAMTGRGGGLFGGRVKPDETSRATLRWVVAGDAEGLERALAKAAKKGCKAANAHLARGAGTKAKGELRPHAEGVLVVVRLEMRAERLDGSDLGAAREAFARALEGALAEKGLAARRLRE